MDHLKIIELVSEIEVYEKYGRLDLAEKPYEILDDYISPLHELEEQTTQWLKQSDKGTSMFVLGHIYSPEQEISKQGVRYFVNGWEKHSHSKCAINITTRYSVENSDDSSLSMEFWSERTYIVEYLLEKKEPSFVRLAKMFRGGKYGVLHMDEILESKYQYDHVKIYALYQHLFYYNQMDDIDLVFGLVDKTNHKNLDSPHIVMYVLENLMDMARNNKDFSTCVKIVECIHNNTHDVSLISTRLRRHRTKEDIKKWYDSPPIYFTRSLFC